LVVAGHRLIFKALVLPVVHMAVGEAVGERQHRAVVGALAVVVVER
jgi:hypothetical protein